MEQKSKITLLIILVIFLLNSPASAGSYQPEISAGDTIYIGQTGLNITNAVGSASYIAYWTDGISFNEVPTAKISILSDVLSDFYVDPEIFAGSRGDWYQYDGLNRSIIAFRVEDDSIAVTSDRNTVINRNPFLVTIEGIPHSYYYLWVSGTNGSSYKPPVIIPYQNDVAIADPAAMGFFYKGTASTIIGDSYSGESIARVKTDSSGKIAVGFETNSETGKASYTIRAQKEGSTELYDSVLIKVEDGELTIISSGNSPYYLGEDILFSGTNTATDNTYLFITGPNLNPNGSKLTKPIEISTVSGQENTFEKCTVKSDDSWEYKLDTINIGLDPGIFTVYAASETKNKTDISDCPYGTTSITVKNPFVTAALSDSVAEKGDTIYIQGTATGNPKSGLGIWILGWDYWNGAATKSMVKEFVNDDGSFEYEISSQETHEMNEGRYFVIVQHPMYNGIFDVDVTDTDNERVIVGEQGNQYNSQFVIWGANRLRGTDAAEALINLINSPDVDDRYTKCTFLIGNQTEQQPSSNYSAITSFANCRLNSLTVNPDSEEMLPGQNVKICADITLKSTGDSTFPGSHSFKASTDLLNPQWEYIVTINGNGENQSSSRNQITLTGYLLDYPSSSNEVVISYCLEGTVPSTYNNTGPIKMISFSQLDGSGNEVSGSPYNLNRTVINPYETPEPTPSPATEITNVSLSNGWNFISFPKRIDSGTTLEEIFSVVDTGGRSILSYNAETKTWNIVTNAEACRPLTGIWIYSNEKVEIHPVFDSNPLQLPPVKHLYKGWNAIGIADTYSAPANDVLTTAEDKWRILIGYDSPNQEYGVSIINNANGIHSEDTEMIPSKGYWLYSTGDAELAATSA